MYLTRSMREGWHDRYGNPAQHRWVIDVSQDEFAMIKRSQRADRAHDITLFILRNNDELVLIKKHAFPPGVYRAPSGGLAPGETLEAGAMREAFEETGLQIELTKYLLSIETDFVCENSIIPWTTDVFSADAVHGILQAHDTEEIAEVRWGTFSELQGAIRQRLLKTGRALFKYRVQLTDAAVAILRSKS